MKTHFSHEPAADLVLRLTSVINTAIDGIITIDEKGTIESMNPAAARLFGYDPDDVIGRNVNMLMPSPDREQHDGYINRYLKTGEAKIIGIGREVKGWRKDGTTFPMRLAVSETRLPDKLLFTGIVHDLSAIKEAEEEVKKLNEQLERKVRERTEELAESINKLLDTNQKLEHEIRERHLAEAALRKALDKEKELSDMKTRFVSMASHEFRTPLSSILSSAELLEAYASPEFQEKRSKHVERIKIAVNNLIGILNDFLSLSRLEEGKIELQPSPIKLGDFCKEVQEGLQNLLKPGQYIRHHGNAGAQTVFLDKNFLKNILLNLLSNAIKYSGPEKPVDCRFDLEDGQLLIKITDQGIGIPLEDQPHLFSRFFRATNAETIQGTGLGLNIVRRYVETLGGTIGFESKLGEGSTFWVNIPLQQN